MAIMTNRSFGAGFSATRLLADIVGRIAAWNDARVTRTGLSALSDRELEDLGLVGQHGARGGHHQDHRAGQHAGGEVDPEQGLAEHGAASTRV